MPSEVAVAGGVAANGVLRDRMVAWGEKHRVTVRLPEKVFCTDNAAMIAFAGLQKRSEWTDPRRVTARSRIR
jgi:N6-L-threonylcarbamoyladenine synthase